MQPAEKPATNGNGAPVQKIETRSVAYLHKTKGWQERFLKALANSGIVVASARAAGVSDKLPYQYRETHPKFAADMDAAIRQSTALIEMHAVNLAINGEKELVYMNSRNGPIVAGERWRKHPRMIEFLLKSRKPEVYGDRIQQEVSGPGGIPFAPTVVAPVVQFVIPENGRRDPAHAQITDITPSAPNSPNTEVQR